MPIIPIDPVLDKPFRRISKENLPNFAGLDNQLLILKDEHRPIVMDGETLGGVFYSASLDDLKEAKEELKEEINLKQDQGSYLTPETGDERYLQKNETAVAALKADQATKDGQGKDISLTYATKNELTAGLAQKAELSHSHTISQVTNLKEVLTTLNSNISAKAPQKHTHEMVDVTGLDSALAGKASIDHTHAFSDIAIDAVALKNIGETWISFDSTIPEGGIPFLGQEVSRELYADLWNWVQEKERVKTEAEWQELASSQAGNCQYYSDGDGSTTFRVPCIKTYFKSAETLEEAGTYIKEGLPNLEGTTTPWAFQNSLTPTGVFSQEGTSHHAYNDTDTPSGAKLIFNASNYNPIYGSSEHVTPETFTILVGVYAIGVVQSIGQADQESILSAITALEASVIKSINGKVPVNGNVDLGSESILTENWQSEDGLNWYRKYSDGWILQGGKVTYGGGDQQVVIQLNTPFTTTTYVPQVTLFSWSSDANVTVGCTNLTTENFKVRLDRCSGAFWIAMGY